MIDRHIMHTLVRWTGPLALLFEALHVHRSRDTSVNCVVLLQRDRTCKQYIHQVSQYFGTSVHDIVYTEYIKVLDLELDSMYDGSFHQ
jgi:hypothetical protein